MSDRRTTTIKEYQEPLTETIVFRCSKSFKQRFVIMSEMYSAGDLSALARHCMENFSRKMIRKEEREKKKKPSKN